MKFKKYSSIENSYRQKEVNSIQIHFPKETFIVTEKIHGANFSFHVNSEGVRCAKRTAFIGEDALAGFYSSDVVYNRYKESAKKVYQEFIKDNPDIVSVSIYGELFGGSYPHPDVEKLDVKRVQKKVYYNNDVDFLMFDIYVTFSSGNGEFVDMNYLPYIEEITEFKNVPVLFKGTLAECLEYENEYPSKVPSMYGLPEIEGNTCEGNVIKPIDHCVFPNGSRVILKNKNASFREKAEMKQIKIPDPLPEHVIRLQKEGYKYITDNRLSNVLSKYGTVDQKEFGKLLGALSKDVIEDFIKDFPEFSELDKKEQRQVTRFINGECGNLIRPNFLNIIDGNF